MRLLLVDDHAAIRLGLKMIISEIDSDIDIIEESNGKEACDLIITNSFDAIVLDIDLPGFSGFEVLRKMRDMGNETPVLMLSMYPEEKYAIQALKAGASGYLSKESARDDLFEAINTIINGKQYVSNKTAHFLANYIQSGEKNIDHNKLSKREFQILKLIGEGKTTNEIATILSINKKTVFTYRSRLMEKMGLKKTSEIIKYVINNGI